MKIEREGELQGIIKNTFPFSPSHITRSESHDDNDNVHNDPHNMPGSFFSNKKDGSSR